MFHLTLRSPALAVAAIALISLAFTRPASARLGGPPPGACCTPSGCVISNILVCTGPNSQFVGPGTTCQTAQHQCLGACCNPAGGPNRCVIMNQFDCGTSPWHMSGSCTPSPCPTADFNASGSVTVQDLFDFLKAWFANASTADFNRSGTVTVQDLFDFLKMWFAKQ